MTVPPEQRLHAFARQQSPFCRAVYPGSDGHARAVYFDTLADLLDAGTPAALATLETRRLLEGAEDPAYLEGLRKAYLAATGELERARRRPPRPHRVPRPRRVAAWAR